MSVSALVLAFMLVFVFLFVFVLYSSSYSGSWCVRISVYKKRIKYDLALVMTLLRFYFAVSLSFNLARSSVIWCGEYLGEFAADCKNILGCESVAKEEMFDEKPMFELS
jgi:hypothetical protein